MAENIKKAKEMMEKGWKAREDHKFEKAEKLLNEAKDIFEKEGDWFNVTECLNHLAYNEKLQAINHLEEGYRLAKESLKLAGEKGTKDVLANRAAMSISEWIGLYPRALKYANKTLETFVEGPDKADILAHMSLLHLKMGHLGKAKEVLEEAQKMFDEYFEKTPEPYKHIWKTKLLLTKAAVELADGDKEKAKDSAKEALQVARDKNIKTRVTEAELLLESLS